MEMLKAYQRVEQSAPFIAFWAVQTLTTRSLTMSKLPGSNKLLLCKEICFNLTNIQLSLKVAYIYGRHLPVRHLATELSEAAQLRDMISTVKTS